MIARSLRDVSLSKNASGQLVQVAVLLLPSSPDLVCNNLFCEKVTLPCLCRLERKLQLIDPNHLKVIDLSGNGLSELPPSLEKFTALEEINISKNKLKVLPSYFKNMLNLKKLIFDEK
jgi:Leucine-rich repeat (LRR) protein